MAITPDTKDWTWVLDKACPECGFDARTVTPGAAGGIIRDAVPRWRQVLLRPGCRRRPDERTWSPLEYACHVRDVFGVFTERLDLMLREDSPTFADWDQDAAALAGDYASAAPEPTAHELEQAGLALAARFDAVPGQHWDREGLRSNGSLFTVATLAQYFAHDIVHHLHDVKG
jgi:hypothetical protein